ncbi:hypothetical protein [Desulfoluna butyratoxydans]|uniref:Uncharacterized protein n=1 Tax=Desulfoluna butyratoxydans TaxID=231438 RepID=A0A4U8YNL7_9BACT|nr:hypothetical protein [Desulfoluna butyratoxydans]VFQ45351.1 hypothetical protein MSL71_30080 [Desulfoluna butyratoxydans]
MYVLKSSDGQHTQLGTSAGNRQENSDGSFWITGWGPVTQGRVGVGASYFLSDADGSNFMSVRVTQIGGAGMGGICFDYNG